MSFEERLPDWAIGKKITWPQNQKVYLLELWSTVCQLTALAYNHKAFADKNHFTTNKKHHQIDGPIPRTSTSVIYKNGHFEESSDSNYSAVIQLATNILTAVQRSLFIEDLFMVYNEVRNRHARSN